jgi:hypothetical protein
MEWVNKRNVVWLTLTQVALGVGVILLAVGMIAGLFELADPVVQSEQLGGVG